MKTIQNFVGGEFLNSLSGQTLDDINPATGKVVAKVARGASGDVDSAVSVAKEAFQSWKKTSVQERRDLLLKVADEIDARLDELAFLETQDTGKPLWLSKQVDIPRAALNFRFFASLVEQASGGFFEMASAFNYTLKRPVGVAGLITPWNLPLYLLSWKVAPALAMGNTIVAKPSEMTPQTANALAEIFKELDAPKGIFNVIHGFGNEAGQAVVSHKDVGCVSFTGGTQTGRVVASEAASQFKKLSLELGGKNPTVVFADCEFEKTVEGVLRASFLNQGQICLCGSRIFVEDSLYENFVQALIKGLKDYRVGDPLNDQFKQGSLISIEHLNKVNGYVNLAKEEGGQVLCGGKPIHSAGGGAFYEPTLIAGLPSNCRTATEEIFGPVVTLHRFQSEDKLIQDCNSSPYGLSASVWTTNLKKAHKISEALEVGMVWVNTWLLRDLRVPFGGVKDSGVGREGGLHSLNFFSESKNVCIQL